MIDPIEGRHAIITIQKALAKVEKRKFVFIGGGIIPLLITDPGASPVRPTKDMDVVFEVASMGDYSFIAQELMNVGFRDVIDPDKPRCALHFERWRVDFLCATPGIVPGSNPWFPFVMQDAILHPLDEVMIHRASAPTFLATKFEAWANRGRLPNEEPDYFHQDIEDILAVLDGRPELEDEMSLAPVEVQAFLRRNFSLLLIGEGFLNALPGHVGGSERSLLVMDRMRRIVMMRLA